MSRENVETLVEMWRRWQRGDEGWIKGLDPQLEWDISGHPLPDFPDRGRGREEFLYHFRGYVDGWLDYSADIIEALDVGDDVVEVLHERARLRDSQAVLDRDRTQVWTMREGRAVLLRAFRTKDEALEAMRLSE